LEAAAAVWGMDIFNEYLKGKKFILYTDHKLEKMGHLHTTTMNRLQAADVIAKVTQCFNPFQPDLIILQKADVDLQRMNHFRVNGKWQENVPKKFANYLQNLAIKLFQDAHNVVWIRLDDYKYPRTAL